MFEAGQVSFPLNPVTEIEPPVNGQSTVTVPTFTLAAVVEHETTS
jgi:hypothetical protein